MRCDFFNYFPRRLSGADPEHPASDELSEKGVSAALRLGSVAGHWPSAILYT
jgi:hypothetical protein